MLKNHLTAIKGRLLLYFTEMYSNMCADSEGKTDYEEFFEDAEKCIQEIMNIKSVDSLDRFCEEWGLNDLEGDLSFHHLAKEYLEIKLEA